MSNDNTQRLSPQGDTRKDEVGGLLAAASDFARSVLESVQALAGTTSCKGFQIARLKDWAITNNCWISTDTLGTFSDRGSENEVYASLDSRYVYKLNDFRYSDDNLTPFFERISIQTSSSPIVLTSSLALPSILSTLSSSSPTPAVSKHTTVFRRGRADHNTRVAYFGIYNPWFSVLDNFLMAKLLKVI